MDSVKTILTLWIIWQLTEYVYQFVNYQSQPYVVMAGYFTGLIFCVMRVFSPK